MKFNGHYEKYMEGDNMKLEMQNKFIELKHKTKCVHGCCSLDDSELFAVMLFTHDNQEVFREIKTNNTGKKIDKRRL